MCAAGGLVRHRVRVNTARRDQEASRFWRNLRQFAGERFVDNLAVEIFAGEWGRYVRYLRDRLACGNCRPMCPSALFFISSDGGRAKKTPELLSDDDYHGACGPLGLDWRPCHRDQYADAVAVETAAEDMWQFIEYLRDRVARGVRLPVLNRSKMWNDFVFWKARRDGEE
jgi:hypothetical protein